MLPLPLLQDHNTDFIVKFPDWDPSTDSGSQTSKLDNMHMLRTITGSRRFLFQETSSDLPQAHLWYSNHKVVNALKLFLAAGNGLAGSLTYRLIIFSYFLLLKIIIKSKILKQLLNSKIVLSVLHASLANMPLLLPVKYLWLLFVP